MSRALGLALGWVADRIFGDPSRWHPVAGFGSLATKLEHRQYADPRGATPPVHPPPRAWPHLRAAGVAHVGLLVGSTAALGLLAERATRHRPLVHTLVTAAATWAVLGGKSLVREGTILDGQLTAGDLPAARLQLRNLVGRDTTRLDPDGVARACVESLAENTSDAVVAPLLWGAVLGLPGLLGYRAINTLDAMIGHRTARYNEFGWAAAKLDDVVNWVPARAAAQIAIVSAALDQHPDGVRGAREAIRRDAPAHPSPNGGVVEAAFAGVLGVTLGGTNVYEGHAEDRGTLGTGPSPAASDIRHATRLSTRVGVGALLLSIGIAVFTGEATRAARARRCARRRPPG